MEVKEITGLEFVIHYDRFTKQIAVLVRDEKGNQVNDTYFFKNKTQAFSFVQNNKLQRVGFGTEESN